MKARTLDFLSCVAPRRDIGFEAESREEGTREWCGGELIQRDELTLLCERCGTEYPIRSGVPHLLPSAAPESRYLGDEMIQSYYEMHFAPYISGPHIAARLSYPQPNVVHSADEGVPVEGFVEVRRSREDRSEAQREFYRSVAQLAAEHSPTEGFYQCILDLSRPFVQQDAAVLDVGCGLGRITAEMARRGASYVIGLDLSPRMVEEAARLVSSQGRLPIKLNLVGGKTVSAKLELSWPLDNCDFIVGDAQQLALKKEMFDLVLCLNLIDRVPNPGRVVGEIRRVLKTGGHLIISDPYQWKETHTEHKYWIANMTVLFNSGGWQRVREVDGVPFVLRKSSRHITIYMNHCLVYRKIACSA